MLNADNRFCKIFNKINLIRIKQVYHLYHKVIKIHITLEFIKIFEN